MSKYWVKVFYLKDKVVAQYLRPEDGKPFYFDASLIAKKVAIGSDQLYLVRVKDGRATRVIKHWVEKFYTRGRLQKIMNKIKEDLA